MEAYYRNKTKTFWFGPFIIGTKAEHFNLFQNYLKSNRNILAFLKVQKRIQNKTELISYRIETFPYTYASEETKQNLCEFIPNFFTSLERFCLLQAPQESKENFCIFKKWYQYESKTLQIGQGFLKTKQNFLLFQKKFGNRPEQKLLDQISLVLIENVLFRSRILFQKRIYSIFFGTKAAKRKLSILKERWFDIASGDLTRTQLT